MVFKGRFFSSKKSSDTSSPEGSNSPRSIGSNSNSPIRSEKKKAKSASKEDHHPPIAATSAFRQTQVKDGSTSTSTSNLRHQSQNKKEASIATESKVNTQTPISTKPSLGAGSASSKSTRKYGAEVPPAVSPILASSLGLNRIKTRSGPLPQESFLGFNRDNSNNNANSKTSLLGASNLSKAKSSSGGESISNRPAKLQICRSSRSNRTANPKPFCRPLILNGINAVDNLTLQMQGPPLSY